jgi:outer membrane protein TolC
VMIEAQESLVTRRQAYIRALGAYARARAELERAVGGRLPQDTTATQPAASRAAG